MKICVSTIVCIYRHGFGMKTGAFRSSKQILIKTAFNFSYVDDVFPPNHQKPIPNLSRTPLYFLFINLALPSLPLFVTLQIIPAIFVIPTELITKQREKKILIAYFTMKFVTFCNGFGEFCFAYYLSFYVFVYV